MLLPTIIDPIFNVTEYGADPTGTNNSTLAIQSAIYYREVVAVDPTAGWIEVDVPTRY